MNYYIRSSKKNDCYELSKTLRAQDAQEVFASGGRNPAQALIRAYLTSHLHCYTIILDDEVVGMFGISKIRDGVGSPWLLGSDKLTDHKFEFHKHAKDHIDTFMDEYNVLFNYVDQRNTQAIKWIKSLGFTFTKLVDNFGYEQKPFYEFVKANNV